jgi:hypothetical protein
MSPISPMSPISHPPLLAHAPACAISTKDRDDTENGVRVEQDGRSVTSVTSVTSEALPDAFFEEFERVLTGWARQRADREVLAARKETARQQRKEWAANLARARTRDKASGYGQGRPDSGCPQSGACEQGD